MTNPQAPEPDSNSVSNQAPEPPGPRSRRWRRWLLPVGGVAAVGLVGGVAGGWWFVHNQLTPLISETLSKSLNRPVQLGDVEQFWLTGLKIGESTLPATATDADRIAIESIEVTFNPLQVLFERTLSLNITANRPEIYVDQDATGAWVDVEIEQEDEAGPITIEVATLRFQDAAVTLVPWDLKQQRPAQPVQIPDADGVVRLSDENRRIGFEVAATLLPEGRVNAEGNLLLPEEAPEDSPTFGIEGKAVLRLQNVAIGEVDRLVALPFSLPTGRISGNVAIALDPQKQLPDLNGVVQFRNTTLAITGLPSNFTQANGSLRLNGTKIRLDDVETQFGKVPVQAGGTLDLDQGYDLTAKVVSASLTDVAQSLNLELPVPVAGNVRSDLQVTGPLDAPLLTGTARNTAAVRLDQVDIRDLSARFQVDAAKELLTVPELRVEPLGGGELTGKGQLNLDESQTIAFDFRGTAINSTPIARAYVGAAAIPFETGPVDLVGQVQGKATNPVVNLASVRVTPPNGGQITGGGQIRLGTETALALQFEAANLPGDAIARAYNNNQALPVTLGTVDASVRIGGSLTNPQAAVQWQARGGTANGRGNVLVANQVVSLRDTRLNVLGGTVDATGQIANGRWQALVQAAGIPLQELSPDLRGLFSGEVTASGSLANLSPAGVRASGQARFSEGIAVIARPLSAQFRWDGRQLILPQATAPGLFAQGVLVPQLQGPGAPGLASLDLNVRLDDFDLQEFTLPLDTPVPYAGRVDFAGRISGTPTDPRVVGDVRLKQLSVNNVAFDPLLQGPVRVNQGAFADLRSTGGDRIFVQTDAAFLPTAFELRRGDAIATGRGENGILQVDVENFPVAVANVPGLEVPPVSGTLNGTGTVNLQTLQGDGTIAIANPAFGTYRADQFTGTLRYAGGILLLQKSTLQKGESRFEITATANVLAANPGATATINVPQGRLQDVLELAQIFELDDLANIGNQRDFGTAADLQTVPIDTTNMTVLDQLRRIAEIQARQEIAAAKQREAPLPPLDEVAGDFTGEINVVASLQDGINAKFDLRGNNWRWGEDLFAQEVAIIGNFEEGSLSLLPAFFKTGESILLFTGKVDTAKNDLAGQLRLENIPAAQVKELLALRLGTEIGGTLRSVDLEGKLNAVATLSGQFSNPQVIGTIQLDDGIFNGSDVQSAQASFRYTDARLDAFSSFLITGNEPLTITASIPYQLPFATVAPASDQVALDVNVKNEGLALINLVNNQVAWVDGQGTVQLQIRGTVLQPVIQGFARFQNATIAASALPEPLTDVNSAVRFEGDRIIVESFSGKFTEGQVVAAGTLPILVPLNANSPDTQPLQISLERIGLNLKGLYRGYVDGGVTLTGTALLPVLQGEITLFDGTVQLVADAPPGGNGAATGGNDAADSPIEFDNLRLILGDRILISQPPVLQFTANGSLTINGNLADLRPAGVIDLTSGQVNLFTTLFTLDRGYPQRAIFEESLGLDPILDVRLIASVPEVTGYRQPDTGRPSEIEDSTIPTGSFGGFRTVRVRAQVEGPASQIFDNLVLTSSPPRSEAEIVSLIGGGFVATLGRGDTALGIANLAGSALLSNVQTVIGNALGLSEFRLFTTLTQDNNSRGASTLNLAAEAAVDITPSVSLSVLKILTNSDPAEFGVRYRLNDNLLLRGSSNLNGDNRFVVEFETRF